MAQLSKKELIEKFNEFVDSGLVIGELPSNVKNQELFGLISAIEDHINLENKDKFNVDLFFQTPESDKQYYIKDEYFCKNEFGVKKQGSKAPAIEIVKPVDYMVLTFPNNNKQKFVKNVPLTEEQLSLFNDLQKEKYLVKK